LVADTLMRDGSLTSSLPWPAAGSMTDLAEGKRARNVEASNARGDRTFGERGNGAKSYRDQAGQDAY
jgi:hypothetical protein